MCIQVLRFFASYVAIDTYNYTPKVACVHSKHDNKMMINEHIGICVFVKIFPNLIYQILKFFTIQIQCIASRNHSCI